MKNINLKFFEQVGNLVYTLAVDRSIQPIEFLELKTVISQHKENPADSFVSLA